MDSANSHSRRDFLIKLGLGGLAAGAALAGCHGRDDEATLSDIPKGQMTHRVNPGTGERVSLLGYGAMRWPTLGEGGELDQEAINRLVDTALAYGVNYFDTSPVYCKGQSERATGIALKRHPRESYFIATKLSNFAPDTWSRDNSLAMYHRSFENLQVDYIDYMLLHAVGKSMEEFEERYIRNGLLDFLLAERAAGRIRNLGFSYHGDARVFDYLLSQHERYRWDFVQIQMNYLDWRHAESLGKRNTNAEYLYGELTKRGIPVIIMEPLLGGRLAKLPARIVARLKQREPERSAASWAFRFAGTHPGVLCVLSGMTYMEHLHDNLRSYCPLKPLTDEEMQFLYDTAELMMQYPTIPCNDCQYCMPCPYGLNIPAILLHYNKCVNDGNILTDSRDPGYAEARRAFLVGYDRSVPKLRQANHCIGCGICLNRCPQGIDIPRELQRIDRYVEQLKTGYASMETLITRLHKGGHSLVVGKGGSIHCYDERGVATLYRLLGEQPELLRAASVADKVVGKGAAALMLLGRVRELHADVISDAALELLRGSSLRVSYENRVPQIRNRDNSGPCPVESCCEDCRSAEECLPRIRSFLEDKNA